MRNSNISADLIGAPLLEDYKPEKGFVFWPYCCPITGSCNGIEGKYNVLRLEHSRPETNFDVATFRVLINLIFNQAVGQGPGIGPTCRDTAIILPSFALRGTETTF